MADQPTPSTTDDPKETTMSEQPNTPTDDTAGLGDAGKKALERERAARKEAERQLKDVRDELATHRATDLRRQVATAKGLKDEQAELLTGDSREEMEAHADRLLAAFSSPQVQRRPHEQRDTLPDGRASTTTDKTPDQVAEEVMRSW